MFRINVKSINDKLLTFNNVCGYNVVDGFVTFTDSKTKKTKRFAVANCEIEEQQ